MKKIINGKMYDTKTAIKISDCSGDVYTSSCQDRFETLYRKTSGEFFRVISYADYKWIEPMSIDKAKKWVEDELDVEAYITLFGEVEE